MEKLFASVITIGDELLMGQVVDTNSAYIGQQLSKSGVLVKARYAVGDDWNDIWHTLDIAARDADVILITGGLGPTADDITKPLLCEYFGGKLVMHQPTLQHITHLFENILKRPMIERNRRQAEVPDVCTVIRNEKGTAPGMLFERDNKIYVSMPGVPAEMKSMLPEVLAFIGRRFKAPAVEHRTLLTAGMGESFLAESISDFEAALPRNIKLAYLPNYGMVRLRLSAFGPDPAQVQQQVDEAFTTLKQRVEKILVADEDIPIELVVGRLLEKLGKTVCTAESCTGGYLSHLITTHPGASAYYKGSIVSYANEVKEKLLQVNTNTLAQHGAVSEATVIEMAVNACRVLQTDYAVSVSGIMGPDGGTEEKPVGLVWVGVADWQGNRSARHFQLRFDRKKNIELTAANAFNFLREFILLHEKATL